MLQSFSETDSPSPGQDLPSHMEPELSLPCSREFVSGSYGAPVEFSPPHLRVRGCIQKFPDRVDK